MKGSELIKKGHQWNLKWAKSELATCSGYSLSPNNRWLIVYYKFHQDPEDRYESVIRDEEYLLFDLHQENLEKEVGRFRYYYNYNSCAGLEESIGSQFQWDDVGVLKLGEIILDLDTMTLEEMKNSLGKYY